MMGKIICWWKGCHNWADWIQITYLDDRTTYWTRACYRCGKRESTRKEPK